MFQNIYIENEIRNHPLSNEILKRFNDIPTIQIERFGEIFNRNNQNFRFQKENPSLIIAKKYGNLILQTPQDYTIGGKNNYYFSHMLNCIFDCRYCFLQGMYRSGNYVIFVNYEDFEKEIIATIEKHKDEEVYFFSGYDCDSLALESITNFAKQFLCFFEKYPKAYLELRTKSININFLLNREPIDNCIVAFSLSPQEVVETLEHRTPSLKNRLNAIIKLQQKGWKVGLRFDPIIFMENFFEKYSKFFKEVFSQIDLNFLHSITLGPFRLPKEIYKKMVKLYPDEILFTHPFEEEKSLISYEDKLQNKILTFCREEILKYIPKTIFFHYEV